MNEQKAAWRQLAAELSNALHDWLVKRAIADGCGPEELAVIAMRDEKAAARRLADYQLAMLFALANEVGFVVALGDESMDRPTEDTVLMQMRKSRTQHRLTLDAPVH